jgi:hypothetical protein
MPCDADSGHDAGTLFRPPEDETGSPHIDPLLNTPSEVRISFWFQLRQHGW